jgi:glutaredoxin 3
MAQVEMYGADWCGYSIRARMLLDRKGVEYHYIDVDSTPGARDEMTERGGGRTIPQIFIDGTPVGGSDELHALEARGELDRLLAAGHP